ncbi:ATP-binding protein [Flavobacterium sp.]|uniref:hybrid sensor histidine kinase/response regulator n=1 Tax=Flavobacterium sp. TaxID=239 RepID=UPI00286E4729|nr:ATP-binding protein [Flavobacterium sp.]
MNAKKSFIPVKIIVSYLALALLVAIVGWKLYSENKVFSVTENKIENEKTKILRISNLLSNLYKTESMARQTIQSNAESDFENYTKQTTYLKLEIDSLKGLLTTQYQKTLLDSVKYLLSKKTENIKQLKLIKNKTNSEVSVKNAINNLTRMELSLSKLRIEDLVQNPSSMNSYQLNVLKKYVTVLNQNIPDDSTNTLTKKASDSILFASKRLLNNVKRETAKRKFAASVEEKKLLENEFSISEQLRKILNIIEQEIIINTTNNNFEKEDSLRKTNNIVTIAAIIGLLLTVFFSILIITDFSKTQSYKTQLEVANLKTEKLLKNREQLISTVSHDLKTPLSTIVGYTELLGNSELNKKQNYFTENIKNSSEYISKLVQDLLDFTQIEAGKITIENIPFSINDMITEVAQSIQSVYSLKPIELSIETDHKLNRIVSDPFRLRQIVSNIIGNAYKFTENGFIKISVLPDLETRLIHIKIEDSGIGIEKEKQELIFEEFTQANENIEKKYGGTGLGLTISKKIIEILGGKLSLKSQYGKGSIFEIVLPLQFEKTNLKEIKNTKNLKDLTVIIVDDDINLLCLTTEVLKQNNCEVLAFTNANQALEAIINTDYDILITDIQMPDIDGFEFVKRIKQSNYKNQPIIAITGKSDLNNEAYKTFGFTSVIRKPFSPKFLIEVVNAIVNNHQIPNEISVSMEENQFKDGYSLQSLKLFLPNKNEAIKDVLTLFVTNTEASLATLEKAILDHNSEEVKQIAHRMYPMFKQIQAAEISDLLQELELKNSLTSERNLIYKDLKMRIKKLFSILEKEILIS